MRLPSPSYRFHPARFLAFKAVPVWIMVAVLGLITVPGLSEDHLVREMLEAAGIMILMAMAVGRFWAILATETRGDGQIAMQGPFRYMAHPLEFFFAFGMMGIGFLHESVLLGLLLFLVCLAASKYWAEAGDELYESGQGGSDTDPDSLRNRYRQLVPAYLPAARPAIVPYYGDQLTYSQHTLRRSAWDIIVFIGCIPIMELVQWWQETGNWAGLITLP